MKLSQTVRYAVMCLFELAKLPLEYFDAESLSSKLGIPPAYTHKVLQALAHAGLITSMKGTGYKISRPLNSISALDVIDALSKDSPVVQVTDASVLIERRINAALENCTLDQLHSAA